MRPLLHQALVVSFCSSFLFALAGCGVSSNSASYALGGVSVKGSLHGGQQPVSQAHVYLMAASTSGYGSASVSLLNSADASGTDSIGSYVLSGSDGSVTITSDYSCSSNQQLYLLALYGNPGLSGSVNATQIGLMAPLGQCSTVNSSTSVEINEVSTIATAYALAGFMSSPTQVAASSSAQAAVSLANAFSTEPNLETLGQARTGTPGGNGTVPQTEINTLANILAACINTSSGASSQCSTLFANAESNGISGTAPTTTAQAAVNIAHNPGSVGISNLFDLQTAESPFLPALTSAPSDFSLAVTYMANGMGSTGVPSVDASGNIWIPSYNGALTELSAVGAQLSPAGGYVGGGYPTGYSTLVDLQGNVWVTNSGTLVKYDNSGNYIGTYSGGNPIGTGSYEKLAIDTAANVWFAHSDSLGEYTAAGNPLSPPTGYANGGGYFDDVRIDSTGTTWVTDKDGYVRTMNSSGTLTNQFQDGAYGASAPVALGVDSSNHVWVADSNTAEVTLWDSSGQLATYSGGGTDEPYSIAIDGAGSAWIANLSGAVSGIESNGSALTPSAGYAVPVNGNLVFDAADGSGNLWVSLPSVKEMMEFVGLTVPVVTPINPNHLGMRP
jgi:streptogramin lyase